MKTNEGEEGSKERKRKEENRLLDPLYRLNLFAINAFLSLKVSRRSGFGFSSSSASPRFLRRLACVAMYHTARVLLAEVVVVVVGATVVVVVTAAAALVVVAATYHTCEGGIRQTRNEESPMWHRKRV
jgi:hypothetical protein